MTIEIDPDLRLYTRLALGRGWRRATTVAVWIAGLALLATGRYSLVPFFLRDVRTSNDPGFLQVALLVLLIAPLRASARLLDLERGGLLDQTRLCGRRPHRVLLAFLAGSTGPFVLLAGVLLVNHLRLDGRPAVLLLALLTFVAALGVSLLVYGTIPPTMSADSRFLTPLMYVSGFVAFLAMRIPSWVQELAFDDPAAQLTAGVVAAVLPLGVWAAYRRVKRPRQATARPDGVSLVGQLSRLVPRAGPPELNRQLRSSLLSGGTAVCLIAAPMVTLLGIRISETAAFRLYSPLALNGVPYALMFIGAFAASMTVRREIESATVDQVRLTPQSPLAAIVSWYVGMALPFWTAAAATVLTLRFVKPTLSMFQWPLVALAIVLPALSICEAFQRRKPGTYVWLPYLILFPLIAFSFVQSLTLRGVEGSLVSQGLRQPERGVVLTERVRALPGGEWMEVGATTPLEDSIRLLAGLAAVLALGAATGRLRRADGPALSGFAAVVGVWAVIVVLRQFPLALFPRVLPGLLALLASFLAEERAIPTPPWRRAAIGGIAAAAGVVVAAQVAGISWSGSLVTATAGACALGAGLIGHELLWRTPLLSMGLRLGILLGLQRWSWATFGEFSRPGAEPPAALLALSPALSAIDVVALAAVFGLVALVHAKRRGPA